MIYYRILLPLEGREDWWELCKCDTLEAALAVLGAVLAKGVNGPTRFRVEVFREG